MYEERFTFCTSELKSNFNVPLCVQHFDNFMIEKNKVNVPEIGDFFFNEDDDSVPRLEDVMMLDDIRKFNMTNCVAFDDQSLPAFIELNSEKTNLIFSSPAQTTSSHNSSPPLKKAEDFLPNFLDASSDTFQDLTPLIPQVTAETASSPSFASDSYSTYTNIGENSSSDSSFTMSSYTSEIASISERSFSPPDNFSSVFEENPSKNTSKYSKYTKSLVIKHETHQDMRRKNNIASQRSRMTRKEKEREMERRADVLERENENLRIKVKKMEEIAEELKRHLLQKILKR